jgi:hypothetical protein
MRTAFLPLLTLFLTGCAEYQYDLVQPPALARHVGPTQTIVPNGPLVYRLQSYDSYLIMLIENPTNDPIRLDGQRSVIIDPQGESHPVFSQTIAPHTFIKLILPPSPAVMYSWDDPYYGWPGYGYGGYGRFGRYRYWRGGYYYYGGPSYVEVYQPPDPFYFDWEGETDVNLNLIFERAVPGAPPFQQSFVFHRRKAG